MLIQRRLQLPLSRGQIIHVAAVVKNDFVGCHVTSIHLHLAKILNVSSGSDKIPQDKNYSRTQQNLLAPASPFRRIAPSQSQSPAIMHPGLRAAYAIVAFLALISDIRTVSPNAASRRFRFSANGTHHVFDAKSGLNQAHSEVDARAIHSATTTTLQKVRECVVL
jgi:hypothetical protein